MGELKREIKTYEVHYICDSCQQGYMIAIDSTPTAHMPLSACGHQCEKCGHTQFLTNRYPQRRTE